MGCLSFHIESITRCAKLKTCDAVWPKEFSAKPAFQVAFPAYIFTREKPVNTIFRIYQILCARLFISFYFFFLISHIFCAIVCFDFYYIFFAFFYPKFCFPLLVVRRHCTLASNFFLRFFIHGLPR